MTLNTDSMTTAAPVPATIAPGTSLAQRYLSLALRYDYLSAGRGHRQSRRVVRDRQAIQARQPQPAIDDQGLPPGDAPGFEGDSLAADAERRYLSEVASKPRLTSREEYCLVGRILHGDRVAYDTLIETNLGLVVMIARRYQRPGIPLLDLIAEGNFGLMRAAERFNREVGCRFSTYASWWVRQAIQLAMPKLSSVVRTPLSHNKAVGHAVLQPRGQAETVVGAGLTADSASDDLAADPTGGPFAMHEAEDAAASFTERAAHASDRGGHIDVRIEASDAEVLDALAIDPEKEPPGAAMANQRMKVLYSALDQLAERDRIIIIARYALASDRPCTLDELATRFEVSIERIRQLENAAIKKLGKLLSLAGESAASLL